MPATKKATTTVKKVTKKDEVKVPETGLKLRIKLKAYDHKIIDNSPIQFGTSVNFEIIS